jgi:4-amino-4-deoxy-L-arabinose transferase-like glycosyltransferase
MKHWKSYVPVAGLFCLALAIRILYNLTVAKNYVAEFDSRIYQQMAFNLISGHCFCLKLSMPTTGRAPLWPGIIAGITMLFGPDNLYVRLFLCVIGSGTCIVVYLFTRDLFGKRIALFAGILASIYPGLFIYDGWLYSESIFTFLLLAFCYTLYLVQQTSKYSWMIISGVLLGLLSLTRPNGLIILGLVILWGIIIARKKYLSWRVVTRGTVIIALIALAIVMPWTIRNYTITQKFVPVATGDGFVLLGAYTNMTLDSTPYKGMWVGPHLSNPAIVKRYPDCYAECEVRQNADYEHFAVQWIQAHITSMPYLLSLHFINMWRPSTPEADLPMNQFPERFSSKIVIAMIPIISIPVFLLAAFGLLVTWRRKWRQLLFIYLMIGLTIAQCIFFYGSSRFRAPIEPMLIILVSGAIWWITLNVQNRRQAAAQSRHEAGLEKVVV